MQIEWKEIRIVVFFRGRYVFISILYLHVRETSGNTFVDHTATLFRSCAVQFYKLSHRY